MRLSIEQARTRLAAARVARLATVDADGNPHLVPITFVVDGDLVIHAVDSKPKRTTALKRLRNIEKRPSVAILADEYDEDWTQLWWARADGRAEVWTEPAARSHPVRLLCAKYAQYERRPPEGPVVVCHVARWSGWRATAE